MFICSWAFEAYCINKLSVYLYFGKEVKKIIPAFFFTTLLANLAGNIMLRKYLKFTVTHFVEKL